MNKRIKIEILLYSLIFIFWGFVYPGHIGFIEQYSLFLYTSDFWKEYMLQPGGWSAYCGSFLAQFYINCLPGALIQTLLFAGLFILSKHVTIKVGMKGSLLWLALLPAFLLLFFQLDHSHAPGNALALICPFALLLLYMNVRHSMLRRVLFTAGIIPAYLFAGAVATCCLYALCVVFEWFYVKDRWKYCTACWLIAVALLPSVWQKVYPASGSRLFPIANLAGDGNDRPVLKAYNRLEEQKFRMYLAVMRGEWDEALKTAKGIKVSDRQAAVLINLSLSMKGELPQRMFNYPQTDEYGLLPAIFDGESIDLLYGSIFYYRIGLLNEALRWITNSNHLRRKGMDYSTLVHLATWNRENGYKQVAETYFDMLDHTLMYRSFAENRRKLPDPVIRALPEEFDFYVGGREPISDIAEHFNNHDDNKILLDYLLCCLLLKNNLSSFLKLYENFVPPEEKLPKAYHEAMVKLVEDGAIDIKDYPINASYVSRLKEFNELVAKGDEEKLKTQFGNTWWYYSWQKAK